MKFEELEKIVDSINDKIIDSFPQNENGGNDDIGLYPRLIIQYISYLGFQIKFEDVFIWTQYDDERIFIEETNDYELLEPFLIEKCKEVIKTYSQIKFE